MEGELLSKWMEIKGIKPSQLADTLNVSRQIIYLRLKDEVIPDDFKLKLSMAGYTIPQIRVKPFYNELQSRGLLVYPAQGSITEGYNDELPFDDMTYINITGYTGKEYRAFKVYGNSMEPLVYNQDIVITKTISQPQEISNDKVYVIVHKTDGIMCKRLYISKKGNEFVIQAVSDNELYSPKTYNAQDILEFWHVEVIIKFNVSKAVPDFQQLQKVEDELQTLKKYIKSKVR